MGATVPRVAGTPSTNSCWTATNTTRPCIRTMFLNEVLDPATGEPVEVLLNNLNLAHEQESPPTPTGFAMNTGPGQAQVNGNSVEEWDIVNVSAPTPTPIHLHTTQFQVIDRQDVDSTRYLAAVNPGLPFAVSPLPPLRGREEPAYRTATAQPRHPIPRRSSRTSPCHRGPTNTDGRTP